MTRWLIRLAFPALGLLIVLLFIGVKAPENTVKKETTSQQRVAPAISAFEAMVPAPATLDGPDIVFKWQDSDGGWHYADQPPANGHWNALAIEPGRSSLPLGPQETQEPPDLYSPYVAPFNLQRQLPENGT